MVSKGRKVARDLLRRRPRIQPRTRILIVCEGVATEPEYFEEFCRDLRAVVELVVDDRGGSPKTLVERAVEEKRVADRSAKRSGDPNARYSEIWCVFDVDAHPLVPEAKEQARAHGIRTAVSNPCFELWLLLHFQDQTAFIERNDAQAACRRHMPGFRKHAPYELLRDRYDAALARAIDLGQRNVLDGEPDKNPSTGVGSLTEAIRSMGRAAFLDRIHSVR